MRKIYTITSLCCCLMMVTCHAQMWVRDMQDPNVNFYDVQKEFNSYWEKIQKEKAGEKFGKMNEHEAEGIGEEESGFTLYKRWEEFTEPRVYPSGKMFDPSFVPREYGRYLSQRSQLRGVQAVTSNWSITGPFYQSCIGCINFIRFHPTDTNTIYAGAASGGLWKSTDGGVQWSTNTDTLGTLGMVDMAFDPTNPGIMYLATGGGGGYAIGLLKSTDGGTSWHATGLNNVGITSVIVNPDSPSVVLASTTGNVYRSTDGGASFTLVSGGVLLRNLKFKPGDPSTVYLTGWNTFYRSTDGGLSFTAITSGLPLDSDLVRMSIGTTPADPDYVYVLTSSLASSNFYGLYLSTDAGLTFTLQSNTPNIVGSQGWFALSIAVSPVNKAEVVVGGLNIYRSVNSGTTWSQISSWNVSAMTGAVHVDIHDLEYYNSTTIFAGCDGGAFKTANSGSNWSNLCAGLQVAQSYSVGVSQNNANLILMGMQDNGTKSFDGTTWTQKIGGDGTTCFIDWSSDTYQYASLPQGWLAASIDGGATFNTIGTGITESTNAWIVPWLQDPDSSATVYAGYTNVWKSTDRGSTWNKISNFTGGMKVIAVCAGYNRCLCVVNNNKIYRTTDGGANWTNIMGSLPTNLTISDVVIKDGDTNKIWVAFSGTSNGNKVYETADGGITWNNISGTLPNLPANTLVYQKNSPDGLYLGMDIGVYYRDTILNSWNLYNTGLPNVVIRQLKIQNTAGKLRASTYGRGIWESDLYVNTTVSVLENNAKANNNYSLDIYPNPGNGDFEVAFFAASKGNYKLELRNYIGQIVYEEILKDVSGRFSKPLNIARFGKGAYMMSLILLPDENQNPAVGKVVVY